jgi:hypothetical protein
MKQESTTTSAPDNITTSKLDGYFIGGNNKIAES